jgi:hypothetical protein
MAVRLCDETPVALAMINTAAPGIDPYGLSRPSRPRMARGARPWCCWWDGVPYDSTRAHGAGVRGLLDKPVATAAWSPCCSV